MYLTLVIVEELLSAGVFPFNFLREDVFEEMPGLGPGPISAEGSGHGFAQGPGFDSDQGPGYDSDQGLAHGSGNGSGQGPDQGSGVQQRNQEIEDNPIPQPSRRSVRERRVNTRLGGYAGKHFLRTGF